MASSAHQHLKLTPQGKVVIVAPTPTAEDAAGEGGEAVATFSNYVAPPWAKIAVNTKMNTNTNIETINGGGEEYTLKKKESDPEIQVIQTHTPTKNTNTNEVIILDDSDEDEDEDEDEDDDDNHKCGEEEKKEDTSIAHKNDTSDETKPLVQDEGQDVKANMKVEVTDMPSHSSPACESGLLASVHSPQPSEECLQIVQQLGREGKLSPLQVEGVGLAIQRHCRLLKKDMNVDVHVRRIDMCTEDRNDNVTTGSNSGSGTRGAQATSTATATTVRAGFFLGDGAGIGKGRQIAAVLRDSLSRSVRAVDINSRSTTTTKVTSSTSSRRRRHLWISVSRELIEDARRDLKDIGCHVPVIDGAELLGGGSGNGQGKGSSSSKGGAFSSSESSGVLFVTYSFLVTGKGRRMNDIISWLVHGNTRTRINSVSNIDTSEKDEALFDGCVIFDEAHKAKNLCLDPPTMTGLLVQQLQERLSHARIMYCSATGVSSLEQMGYATRLGLWGDAGSTNFPTFDTFKTSLEKRGVGAMELLALEMKQAGCFVARTLSWDGAEFDTVRVSLSEEQRDVYDQSMIWWQFVKNEIKLALEPEDMNGTPKMLWSQYWSAIQRFAKELAICAKVPSVANSALEQIESGHSIVIGLQSTGEASAIASLEELKAKMMATQNNMPVRDLEDIPLPGILSTAAAIMSGFVRNHFPVAPLPKEPVKVPPIPPGGFTSENERILHEHKTMLAEQANNAPPPRPKPELLQKRKNLLNAIDRIRLPPSPLDDLIDRLGGVDNVAEMTGRSGRIIRSKSSSRRFQYKRRVAVSKESKFGLSMPSCSSQEDSDRLNIIEKKKFMDGSKNVAIISDAASTGISLHAASGSGARKKRRVHYTIELPWAADKAIQQLGRTHRSGQLSAPIYKMVVTDLGGERRFAAAVAKRMAGLGALTKGDRRAATGSDLSEFDIDSRFGRRSLKRFYDCMTSDPPYAPSKTSNVILDAYIPKSRDIPSYLTQTDKRQHALVSVKMNLDIIGIEAGSDARKTGNVKVFLNRIAALSVLAQNLIFQLFTSTMEDVISEAKVTGEFQESVEDIRATSIELSSEPEVLTVDKSCGAVTKLAIFNVDRGCSFSSVCSTCLDLISPFFAKEKPVEVNNSVALSGFYLSNREIMGRKLVLFARRKIQVSSDETENENMIDFDPRGLMVLTRPNTGTNPCEMSTSDLNRKYNLIASIDDVRDLLRNGNPDTSSDPQLQTVVTLETLLSILSQNYSTFSRMWQSAYDSSNNYQGDVGLAPRRAKIGMVTGSVLHCLPILEKSVASMEKQSDRSLKIVRVEASGTNQRYVGIKFPVKGEAIESLTTNMEEQKKAGLDSNGGNFIDEIPDNIQEKSVSWVTSPPVTMKTFFKSFDKTAKRKVLDENTLMTKKAKRHTTKQTKTSSITSFFTKKTYT